MKKCYWNRKLVVFFFAVSNLAVAALAFAGPYGDYSRSQLMGNSGLAIFREADYGNQNGLGIYIDGVPVTTLSRGEGYRAIVRPGRHLLTVTNTPSPYGKTRFTTRRVDLAPGQNYAFTAIWEVETVTIADGEYQYHGFYR